MSIYKGGLSVAGNTTLQTVNVTKKLNMMAGSNLTMQNGLNLEATGVWQIGLTKTGNEYTLTEMKLNGTTRTIGHFSRATSLSRRWASGTVTVTASPQDEKLKMSIKQNGNNSDTTWDGLTGKVKVYTNLDDGESWHDTEARLTVTAPFTERSFVKGYGTDDNIYYGKLYDEDGHALTSRNYYWYGFTSNIDGGHANATLYTHN